MESTEILIVEDDPVISQVLSGTLSTFGYSVCGQARSGDEAILQVIATNPDLVMMDIGLEGICDGIVAATYIHQFFSVPVVFCTGQSGGDSIERAKTAQPFGYLSKPFSDQELYGTIEIALNSHALFMRRFGIKGCKLDTLLSLDTGIMFLNNDGRVLFSNPSAGYLTGCSHNEAFFQHINDIMDCEPVVSMMDEEFSLWGCITETSMIDLIGTSKDLTLRLSGGRKRHVRLQAMRKRDYRGVIIGYVLKLDELVNLPARVEKRVTAGMVW